MYVFYVFYRNASLYSGCVNAVDCSGMRYNRLILDVRTAKRHAELHQNVCANAVREGPSLLTYLLITYSFCSSAVARK